jgi:hypothetical protein
VSYLAALFGSHADFFLIGSGIGVLVSAALLPKLLRHRASAVRVFSLCGIGLSVAGLALVTAHVERGPSTDYAPANVGTQVLINGAKEMATKTAPITITGRVRTDGGQAVLFPDPGQTVTKPTLLTMRDIPLNGSAQQKFHAAVAYFADKAGPLSVTGTLIPFNGDFILIVIVQ